MVEVNISSDIEKDSKKWCKHCKYLKLKVTSSYYLCSATAYSGVCCNTEDRNQSGDCKYFEAKWPFKRRYR